MVLGLGNTSHRIEGGGRGGGAEDQVQRIDKYKTTATATNTVPTTVKLNKNATSIIDKYIAVDLASCCSARSREIACLFKLFTGIAYREVFDVT